MGLISGSFRSPLKVTGGESFALKAMERPADSFSRDEILSLLKQAREAADLITRTDLPIIREALALYNQDLLSVVHYALSEGGQWR